MSEIILKKLLDYTKDLIERKGWKFKLEELDHKSELHGKNINRKVIKVRLRSQEHYEIFMSWEFILGTFIHELAHMEIWGHDKKFYELIDILDDEIYDDNNNFLKKIKGCVEVKNIRNLKGKTELKGKKFGGNTELKGKKLGGNKIKDNMRNKMLNAALKRQNENI